MRRVATESRSRRKCHVSFESSDSNSVSRRSRRVESARSPETLSAGSRSRRGAGRHTNKMDHRTRATATTCTATQAKQASAGALMFPPSCLDGGITRVGTVHPCPLRLGGCGRFFLLLSCFSFLQVPEGSRVSGHLWCCRSPSEGKGERGKRERDLKRAMD